ncbi:hypothetical protein FGO68_gene6975 [Halteria grandinella]|uniref:Uncharacterized protein n=1 Tax=Halteria grandinella TaxID=5974 RepID=A0A8J8NZN8_HALGN|nr:hypothetical protein FGO68_gene6975 [Halteria grandinella]
MMLYQISSFAQLQEVLSSIPQEASQFNKFEASIFEKACYHQASHFEKVYYHHFNKIDDNEYLRVIVSTYDEVFQLGGNVESTITILKRLKREERENMDRERYFSHCRDNWKAYSRLSNNKQKQYIYESQMVTQEQKIIVQETEK